MKDARRILAAIAAASLLGCAAPETREAHLAPCSAGMRQGTLTTLFLGRSDPDGRPVTETQFQAFLDAAVTPRFPGYTAADATGSWRGTREATKLLIIAHCGEPGVAGRLDAISGDYRSAFRQESVGRADASACHNFCSGP